MVDPKQRPHGTSRPLQIWRSNRVTAGAGLEWVIRVARQSPDGRCHQEADVGASADATHADAKIESLRAIRRHDAIPQRADVVGDGLPVVEPGSVEVRFCIAGSAIAAATAGRRSNCSETSRRPPGAMCQVEKLATVIGP